MRRILLVGSGAREDAIAHALVRDADVRLFAAMSSTNPGITRIAEDARAMRITDPSTVSDYAEHMNVEAAVIGPEAPLVSGVADALTDRGIGCVGPTRTLAAIEGDKAFCRTLLSRHKIPGNPMFQIFSDVVSAERYLRSSGPVAIKPIGLTGGKGVKVTGEDLPSKQAELDYARQVFKNKIGGEGLLIEEKLEGEEYTLQAFVDGTDITVMPLVQDHKRAFENDAGPNTGGMGSYSCSNHSLPFVSQRDLDESSRIMSETVNALPHDLGREYKGILYGQFMLAKAENEDKPSPKLIEFNCRFGDPEAMNVLSVLDTGLMEVCDHIIDGSLRPMQIVFQEQATVCKYLVPQGYPVTPMKGEAITVDEDAIAKLGGSIFYANVDVKNSEILTGSSRTVAVLGVSETVEEAEKVAEAATQHVKGPLMHRSDIGTSRLIAKRIQHVKSLERVS